MAETTILASIMKIGTALGNGAGALFAKYGTELIELQGSMGRIMSELRVIHASHCQMDIRDRNNQVYEVWLEEVRGAAYMIEDIVDEYMYLVGQEHNDVGWCFYMKKAFRKPKALLSLSRIASMVKEAEKNLAHLSQTKERWISTVNGGGTNSHSYIVQRSLDQATDSLSLGEEDLVGIEDNKRRMMSWIGDDEFARSVIVVHGMGGLGKTALAATVYKKEQGKFDCHAWVSISQTYTREGVLARLITELFKDKQSVPSNIASMNLTQLRDRLKSILENQKYLIVLDDVWNFDAYTDLFGSLTSNQKGSTTIMTTRIDDLVQHDPQNRILKIKLEPLSENESWDLFCKKAFPNQDCCQELKDLSKKIVDKCGCLPLAIVSIGSLLRGRAKTTEEWTRIHNQLRWELVNHPNLEHVRNVLHLSFIYLPTYLKSCFLYCSLFPEDYLFHRKKLVRLWVAEGFVWKRGQSSMEEVAEVYLKELVHRNMLQLIERNSFGRMKLFRLHDIVRELALDMCRRECFGVAHHDQSLQEKSGRRLLAHTLQDIEQSISRAISLRSILTMDNSKSSHIVLPLVAHKCRYLSVLELPGLSIEIVPDVVGELFNLRYLGLRDSKVKLLPKSIEKLSNLLTLDVCNSEIQELPRGIVKLKKLRHLFAEKAIDWYGRDFRCRSGVRIPKDLGNLMDLQTLQALEAEDESIGHLRKLTQMRSMKIRNVKGIHCGRLCESLVEMRLLSYLSLATSDENEVLQLNTLNPVPPNLKGLGLIGRLAEGTLEESPLFQTARQHMCVLSLNWSQLRKDPLPCLSRLSNLSMLWLSSAYTGEQLVFLSGWFPKLKELYLRDLLQLKQLVIQPGTMTSLQKLVLVNLRSLTEVPPGIESLMPLKYLLFREITPDFLALLRGSKIASMRWLYDLRD